MIKLVESCMRFLQRCFQIAAARLPKATCDKNGSAKMCLCSCLCDPDLFSLSLYGGSAATLEQPAPQKTLASSHSAAFDIGCAAAALKECSFPFTNRRLQCEPTNILCGGKTATFVCWTHRLNVTLETVVGRSVELLQRMSAL